MRKSSNLTIRVVAITSTSRSTILGIILGDSATARRCYNCLWIVIDHIARNCLLNRTSTTLGITEIPLRQTRHTPPWSIIMPVPPAIWSSVSRTVVPVIPIITAVSIVTVVTRTWISLVIRQRVPTNVIAK